MHFADGFVITGWRRLSLRETYTDPLGELSFEVSPTRENLDDYRSRCVKGAIVNVDINGVRQGQFLVQTVEKTISKADGIVYRMVCQTPLAVAYEASVNPDLTFKTENDSALTVVVLQALSPYGFTTAVGDTAASVNAITGKAIGNRRAAVDVPALKHKEAQAQDGESAYRFCARLCTRLGVVIRVAHDSDVVPGNGSLLLGAPDYGQETLYTVCATFGASVDGADRFFGPLTILDTNENQFSECIIRGHTPKAKGARQTARPSSQVQTVVLGANRGNYQCDALPFKPLIIKDKQSRDVERCESTAKLALGLRLKDAYVVSGEVDGFVSRTGALWQVDTTCRVVVEMENLDEPMWVLERTFKQDKRGGQSTILKLIPLNSLVIGDLPS